MTKIRSEWESFAINQENIMNSGLDCNPATYRLKVFGGWLVAASEIIDTDSVLDDVKLMNSMFVPDPKHEWVIDWEEDFDSEGFLRD